MSEVQLGDLMIKKGGSIDPRRHPDETFELYSVPSFENRKPEKVCGSEIGSSKQNIQANDVLLCKIVPHIRRAWVVGPSNGHRLIASSEWIIFRGENFFPAYLRHFFLSDWFHSRFMKTVSGVGGSLLRARPAEVSRIRIPLPQMEEQKHIAAILDQADAIRGKRRKAIAKLDELLQSVFLDMFGDPVQNPKEWPVVKIGDLLESVNYGSSKKASQNGKWPILRMNNITYSGEWDFSDLKYIDFDEKEESKYLVYAGEILFNRTNSKELVGKTAVFRESKPMAFAGYLVRGRVNGSRAVPEYISGYMNSHHGKKTLMHMCKNIVGMANINAKEFQNIKILHPLLSEQNRYQKIVHRVKEHKNLLHSDLLKFDTLFSSLQQRAFNGEL